MIQAVEAELERLSGLIMAAESWGPGYAKAPDAHAKLIATTAKLERKLRGFFKAEAGRVNDMVNWYAYQRALYETKASRVDAYEVNVLVNNDGVADGEGLFITVVFDDIAYATALGAEAGEAIYQVPLGIMPSDALIQRLAREQTGKLVSRRLDKNGLLVRDTTPAAHTITDTTIKDIQESISTSLTLGEDVQVATKRLQAVINNPKRAERIAHTEMVNAYGAGQNAFANESGAVGKEWDDTGAVDVCAENTAAGPIPLDEPYPSGDLHIGAHPYCRCSERFIYPEEWARLGN